MRPFHALYSHECQALISLESPSSKIESFNQMIQQMRSVYKCAKQHKWHAQEKSKFYAKQLRSLIQCEVGHNVLLKVTPKHTWLELERSRGLSPRFCGSFPIEMITWHMHITCLMTRRFIMYFMSICWEELCPTQSWTCVFMAHEGAMLHGPKRIL